MLRRTTGLGDPRGMTMRELGREWERVVRAATMAGDNRLEAKCAGRKAVSEY